MTGGDGSTWSMFLLYSGNGLLMLAYVASLVFLFVREKEKSVRAILIYLSFAVLALFFFPPFAYLWMNRLGEEQTYYRFLWMLPEGIVCSYALVRFLELVKWKWVKITVTVLVTACVMIGGNLVYNSPVFTKATNWYQIPDGVEKLCDAIVIPGREVKAVFPTELLQYVRQYTAYVVLPYGYETMVQRWGFSNEIFDEMNREVIDTKKLCGLCREEGCLYIVLEKHRPLEGRMEDCNYILEMTSGNYDLYRDATGDFWAPDMEKLK